jgi:hypothetical protein
VKNPTRGINIIEVLNILLPRRRFIMYATKTAKRLETEVEKLNNIINSLVEENYLLKNMLTQNQSPTDQKRKK